MDGHLVPPGYAALTPFPRNWFENIAAVQFDHRVLATITALLAIGAAHAARRAGQARPALIALGLTVALQYGLGVATLLWSVPIPLAVAHQATAMLALTAALVALHHLNAQSRVGA